MMYPGPGLRAVGQLVQILCFAGRNARRRGRCELGALVWKQPPAVGSQQQPAPLSGCCCCWRRHRRCDNNGAGTLRRRVAFGQPPPFIFRRQLMLRFSRKLDGTGAHRVAVRNAPSQWPRPSSRLMPSHGCAVSLVRPACHTARPPDIEMTRGAPRRTARRQFAFLRVSSSKTSRLCETRGG